MQANLTIQDMDIQQCWLARASEPKPRYFRSGSAFAFKRLADTIIVEEMNRSWRILRMSAGLSENVTWHNGSSDDSSYVPSSATSSESMPSLVPSSERSMQRPGTPHPRVGNLITQNLAQAVVCQVSIVNEESE